LRLACHPQARMPRGKGFQGVDTVWGQASTVSRDCRDRRQPLHGMTSARGGGGDARAARREDLRSDPGGYGTAPEDLQRASPQIHGGLLNFQETFIDAGDVDMLEGNGCTKRRLRRDDDADHVPRVEDAKEAQVLRCARADNQSALAS